MSSVSVVIPSYKASPFIRETLQSVFEQSRLPDELIVVDDCSPDDTVAVVEHLAKDAPVPVRVIRLPTNTGGPTRPLNIGIEKATGDFIATLDHDDQFAPNKLKDQFTFSQSSPNLTFVFGDLEFVGPDETFNRRVGNWLESAIGSMQRTPWGSGFVVSSKDATAAIVRWQSFVGTCSNMFFRKSAWRRCGGFDEATTVSGDLAFLADIAAHNDIGYLPTPSARWQLRSDSLYRSSSEYFRVKDQLHIFARMTRRGLPRNLQLELNQHVREIAYDTAYAMRETNEYRKALGLLWQAIRVTGPWRSGVMSLLKLLPHRLMRRSENKLS